MQDIRSFLKHYKKELQKELNKELELKNTYSVYFGKEDSLYWAQNKLINSINAHIITIENVLEQKYPRGHN